MSTSSHTLRLGPLPTTAAVKLTSTCPASLKADLDQYAALHAQAYGKPVDAAALIPHMLEAFMARDQGFKKANALPSAERPRTGTGKKGSATDLPSS